MIKGLVFCRRSWPGDDEAHGPCPFVVVPETSVKALKLLSIGELGSVDVKSGREDALLSLPAASAKSLYSGRKWKIGAC